MKKYIFSALVFLSVSTTAQTKLAIDLSMGSSFKGILTTIGAGAGVISPKGVSALMLTLESDQVFNSDLIAFNMADRIKPLDDGNVFSNNLGIRYTGRIYRMGEFSIHAVVQPWTSLNVHVTSMNIGTQIAFTHKGDIIALQYVHDVKYSRNFLKFIFTVTQKPKK